MLYFKHIEAIPQLIFFFVSNFLLKPDFTKNVIENRVLEKFYFRLKRKPSLWKTRLLKKTLVVLKNITQHHEMLEGNFKITS